MKNIKITTIVTLILFFMSFLPISEGISKDNKTNSRILTALETEESDPYSDINIMASNDEGLTLEFTPPEPDISSRMIEGEICHDISIAGLYNHEVQDMPSLPVQGVMLGIPVDADVSVKVLEVESQSLKGSFYVCPTARPVVNPFIETKGEEPAITFQYDDYPKPDEFFPTDEVSLVETGMIRSQRYAVFRFSPLQYNPQSGELIHFARMVIKISFVGSSQTQVVHRAIIDEGLFEDSLSDLLLNYERSRIWRSSHDDLAISVIEDRAGQEQYKILVDQDGIYRISYTDLAAEGIDVNSINPTTFQLYNQSTEVAIHVEGEENNLFETGEYLLFYGEKIDTKYTETNVYWLRWGVEEGLRMIEVDGTPSGSSTVPSEFLIEYHLEIDSKYYSAASSGVNKDHWYWGSFIYQGKPGEYSFNLANLSTGSHTITLRGMIKPYYTIDTPPIEIYINGNTIPIFNGAIDADPAISFETYLQQSDLIEGENSITVKVPNSNHYVLTNWFEIEYYDTFVAENNQLVFEADLSLTPEFAVQGFNQDTIEAYDISDPKNPIRLTDPIILPDASTYTFIFEPDLSDNRRFLVQGVEQQKTPNDIQVDIPSYWQTTENGADYIIISHADFLDPANELADFRRSQGYEVTVVDIQDIYDEFSGGIFTPDAIKLFLTYAYEYWAPQPSFVLLVGDGHYDFKDILLYGSQNFIPPYLDDVDPDNSERPTDNRYVCVSGDDILPDMYIGRFPVNTVEEAQLMVERTIEYENHPTEGEWKTSIVFVADDPDSGGPFHTDSDALAEMLPSEYSVSKIYYGEEPYTNPTAAESAITNAINAGRLIVHYAGHGDTLGWAWRHIYEVDSLDGLNNVNIQPFMMPMTCSDGYYVFPDEARSSLGESIVRQSGGGAVGSWSPGGNGFHNGHMVLSENFIDNLFNHGHNQVGFLTTEAKYHLHLSGVGFSDLIETYHLFGDPALRLQTKEENYLYLPIIYN